MNIKQALKRKNKLIKEISVEFSKLQKYNSVAEGTDRVYNPRSAMDGYIRKTASLIALKTAIHRANTPVYDKIFRLSELKSIISQIRGLDCQSGVVHSRNPYSSAPDSAITYTAEVSIIERDQIVEKLEAELEMLQDDLDRWNATADIDWIE